MTEHTAVKDLPPPLAAALSDINALLDTFRHDREQNERRMAAPRTAAMADLREALEESASLARRVRAAQEALRAGEGALSDHVNWVYEHGERTYNRADLAMQVASAGAGGGSVELELPALFLDAYAREHARPAADALLARLCKAEERVSMLVALAQATGEGGVEDAPGRLREVLATMVAALAAVAARRVVPLVDAVEEMRRATREALEVTDAGGRGPARLGGYGRDPFAEAERAVAEREAGREAAREKAVKAAMEALPARQAAPAPAAAVPVAPAAAAPAGFGAPFGTPAAAPAAPAFGGGFGAPAAAFAPPAPAFGFGAPAPAAAPAAPAFGGFGAPAAAAPAAPAFGGFGAPAAAAPAAAAGFGAWGTPPAVASPKPAASQPARNGRRRN